MSCTPGLRFVCRVPSDSVKVVDGHEEGTSIGPVAPLLMPYGLVDSKSVLRILQMTPAHEKALGLELNHLAYKTGLDLQVQDMRDLGTHGPRWTYLTLCMLD